MALMATSQTHIALTSQSLGEHCDAQSIVPPNHALLRRQVRRILLLPSMTTLTVKATVPHPSLHLDGIRDRRWCSVQLWEETSLPCRPPSLRRGKGQYVPPGRDSLRGFES
jgi:hypothetical protein